MFCFKSSAAYRLPFIYMAAYVLKGSSCQRFARDVCAVSAERAACRMPRTTRCIFSFLSSKLQNNGAPQRWH